MIRTQVVTLSLLFCLYAPTSNAQENTGSTTASIPQIDFCRVAVAAFGRDIVRGFACAPASVSGPGDYGGRGTFAQSIQNPPCSMSLTNNTRTVPLPEATYVYADQRVSGGGAELSLQSLSSYLPTTRIGARGASLLRVSFGFKSATRSDLVLSRGTGMQDACQQSICRARGVVVSTISAVPYVRVEAVSESSGGGEVTWSVASVGGFCEETSSTSITLESESEVMIFARLARPSGLDLACEDTLVSFEEDESVNIPIGSSSPEGQGSWYTVATAAIPPGMASVQPVRIRFEGRILGRGNGGQPLRITARIRSGEDASESVSTTVFVGTDGRFSSLLPAFSLPFSLNGSSSSVSVEMRIGLPEEPRRRTSMRMAEITSVSGSFNAVRRDDNGSPPVNAE